MEERNQMPPETAPTPEIIAALKEQVVYLLGAVEQLQMKVTVFEEDTTDLNRCLIAIGRKLARCTSYTEAAKLLNSDEIAVDVILALRDKAARIGLTPAEINQIEHVDAAHSIIKTVQQDITEMTPNPSTPRQTLEIVTTIQTEIKSHINTLLNRVKADTTAATPRISQ